MKKNTFAIIEIGSNNTKTHVYNIDKLIYEHNKTIEFKTNYKKYSRIIDSDLNDLFKVIDDALKYTENIHLYGCSIFRNIKKDELEEINEIIYQKYNIKIEVVTNEQEAKYTASGCINDLDYEGNICILISGGGSSEVVFVNNKEIKDRRYYDFGALDVTNKYPSLKSDFPTVKFDETVNYVTNLLDDDLPKSEIFILSGGNHPYWYQNAGFKMYDNTLYKSDNQKYMIPIEKSDEYDRKCFNISLDNIKNNSDDPLWFNGARGMKVITYALAHKIEARYIIPTKINMEIGIRDMINGCSKYED